MPEGTQVHEAETELFHSGKNEDGASDDITMNVMPVQSEPWHGTRDISELVRQIYASPDRYDGFRVSLPAGFTTRQVEKGFYLDNDIRRTSTSMGRSPRMLLKLKLPAGSSTGDIVMPFLPTDHDLRGVVQAVLMMQFVRASDYPSDRNASQNW